MYKLRYYQDEAIDRAVYNLQRDKAPFIVQAATGAGKSLIIAGICKRLNDNVLILQPSKEILEQNFAKLVSYDPLINAGIYSASKGRKEIARFTFATIGSIYKKPELFEHFKYVLIDECHGVNSKKDSAMLTTFLKAINCQHVCGLTATPYRLDIVWLKEKNGDLTSTASLKMLNRIFSKSTKPFFKDIVYQIETAELQAKGYLAPVQYYRDPTDWRGLVVNSTGADFTVDSQERWARKRIDRIMQAIEYSHDKNKRTLVFCGTIKQAEEAKERLAEEYGLRAEMVTGATPKKERERLIAEFKAGTFKHMLNVGVFTTGFDVPILDCVVLARPTMSLALYYQMVGRGIRTDPDDPNKVLKVYDLCGVVERLGRVETITVRKEILPSGKQGFRDEVWSEAGRMDGEPLYSFTVTPKEKKEGKTYEGRNVK